MWNDATSTVSGAGERRGGPLFRSIARVLRRAPARRRISLALQGGGSFGAFTWGVLDSLLEHDETDFDCVSGASAGAVNAVVLADGLTRGGPQEARARLERFWKRASGAIPRSPFRGKLAEGVSQAAMGLLVHVLSPHEFNPLGLDPLRDLLEEEIDFERLRRSSSVRLLIAATRVRDGGVRLFREYEITVDAVLASACLPLLQPAVEIDGEQYWDGGYSANPPLRALALESTASELLLVRIIPRQEPTAPTRPPAVARRVDRIAFNTPLDKELEALEDLCRVCRSQGAGGDPLCRKLGQLRLHVICAEQTIDGLSQENALDLDWPFLLRLKEAGRRAAEDWRARTTGPRRGRRPDPLALPAAPGGTPAASPA